MSLMMPWLHQAAINPRCGTKQGYSKIVAVPTSIAKDLVKYLSNKQVRYVHRTIQSNDQNLDSANKVLLQGLQQELVQPLLFSLTQGFQANFHPLLPACWGMLIRAEHMVPDADGKGIVGIGLPLHR